MKKNSSGFSATGKNLEASFSEFLHAGFDPVHVSRGPRSVEISGTVSESVRLVMDAADAALYDFGNAPGVTDGPELTDEQYRAVLDGKAYVKHGVVRYFPVKKTFHGVDVEAEREKLRNARKLAQIADELARRDIAIRVPGRSVPTQSEIEVVWLP